MMETIKQEIMEILGVSKIDFKELEIPSKNLIFLISSNNNKYILKIYKTHDDKENTKSFNREREAINYFSSHLDEVESLIFSEESEVPWILMKFFKGPNLKSTEDFELYKKTINLMLKLHSLKNSVKKPKEVEILGFYDKKLQEVKQRIKKYLPENYDENFLITIIDNFYLCYREIYLKSNNLVHGDFVDRNIIVNDKLHLIDFENSHIGPLVEDLVFFIENSKLNNLQKNHLIKRYSEKINFNKKTFLILTLLTKLRVLGSFLRIKKNKLEKFEDRINDFIEQIKDTTEKLKNYNINLIKNYKENWEEIFSAKGTFFNDVHSDLKLFVESLNKKIKILDLGCGSGRHTVFFASEGFDVTGIDSAKKGIEITQEIIDEKNLRVKLICKDFYEKLPFGDNTFDVVVSTQAMHHNRLYYIKKLTDEIKRVLKQSGKIFITVPKIKDIFHKEPLEIEKNTFIPTKGNEQGVVHHYFDISEIKEMFSDFEIEIKEDVYNHYVITGFLK